MGNNFGATLLDVQGGMEYAKANQRRDANWEREQKRADIADKTAQYGLEDLEQSRGDKAARRTAAAGAPSLDAAAQAEKAAALSRGDTAGATQADAGRLAALRNDYLTSEAQLAKELQPAEAGMKRVAVAGQVARQPGMEANAGQQVQDQSMAMREKLLARFYQIANIDKNEALKLISDSPLVFPGKKAVDIMVSKDGQRMAIVGEDGQPLTMLNKQFLDQLSAKYSDPGKVYEVEPGKRLVHATPSGKAKEIYAAPGLDTAPKLMPITEGTTGFFNPKTGTTIPVGGGNGQPPTKTRNANFKISEDIISKRFGGSLNMGITEEHAQRMYQSATKRAEEYITRGMAPAAAADKAIEDVMKENKIAEGKNKSGLGAGNSDDWKSYLPGSL